MFPLTNVTETRTAATKSGGLNVAVTMIKDDDLSCRRYACIALCNMGNSPNSQEQIVVHGALPMVLKMVENGGDIETQRQALLTLTNLCANDINHSTMMQKQVMRVLQNAYASDDADCREYAAFAIANIATNPDYVAMVGNNGGIPPLIMLTRSQSINTACLGISALRRLANNEVS